MEDLKVPPSSSSPDKTRSQVEAQDLKRDGQEIELSRMFDLFLESSIQTFAS
jgi:hypothetical protein